MRLADIASRPWFGELLCATVIFCGGLVVGRGCRAEGDHVLVSDELHEHAAAYTGAVILVHLAAERLDVHDTVTRWRTEWRLPSGATVAESVETDARDLHRERTEETSSDTRVAAQVADREHQAVRVVNSAPPLPRLSIGVLGGFGLDGSRHYGPDVRVRLVGPLWLGAWIDVPGRAGGAALAFTLP